MCCSSEQRTREGKGKGTTQQRHSYKTTTQTCSDNPPDYSLPYVHCHRLEPFLTISQARIARKSITDTAKDALKTVNDVASRAALKGVEGTEKVTEAAKSTVAGTVAGSGKTAEGMMDKAKGEAKKMQGQAESKAEEVKQKL